MWMAVKFAGCSFSSRVPKSWSVHIPCASCANHSGFRHVSYLLSKITAFVNADDNMEKLFDVFSGATDGRQHRHTEQLTELYVIQRVTAASSSSYMLSAITMRTFMSINWVGEIQVPFQIGRVHRHINNDIRSFVDDVMANINLFWENRQKENMPGKSTMRK